MNFDGEIQERDLKDHGLEHLPALSIRQPWAWLSDLEKFYDEEIAPKLKEVGELCVKRGMPFLALVEFDGDIGETSFRPYNEGLKMLMV